MKFNKKILICTGGSRQATVWARTETTWQDFVRRVEIPQKSPESLEEYLKLPKAKQDELKDVGGFVGGTFKGDRRKAVNVEGRDLITLDLDSIGPGGGPEILKRVAALGCASLVYSTRKHAPCAPRLRIVIPLDRTATADEYEPAARKLAQIIGMEFCDPTTFETSRLMYWPSICADSEYIYQVIDLPFCSLDGILGQYGDWKNVAEWPQVPGADAIERRRLAKQTDPTTKGGIVGAFCRVYTVTDAIENFIRGMYEPTDIPDRYTYTGGTTTGGAVVYDGDLFMFSHHATDPCSGLLVNAFDLVRLHKFGELDADVKLGTPAHKLPSFTEMAKFAGQDEKVKGILLEDRYKAAQEAFSVPVPGEEIGIVPGKETFTWVEQLDYDKTGGIKNTTSNCHTILTHDPILKDIFRKDVFSDKLMIVKEPPWDGEKAPRQWSDSDDAGLICYLEAVYQIGAREKAMDALLLAGEKTKVNAVKDYLDGLTWDGTKRLDTLLTDYLGAEDNVYTRAVMRKSLCAAVARGVVGGVKYDYMPILAGPQGIGKSTLLNILGGDWFCDSLTTFEGREAAEMIQGYLIIEVGELTAMNRQENNAVKQFLSKPHDVYRAPYARRTAKHPRRCVFFGTSNDTEFLRDHTGGRRFWPVDVGIEEPKKSVWDDLPKERDQIWAEAYLYWRLGEPLRLTGEAERIAKEQQEEHREVSEKEGIIQAFLEQPIPENWDDMELFAKRQFIRGQTKEGAPLVKRSQVCAMEIWEVCFNGDLKSLKKSEAIEINRIISRCKGWKRRRFYHKTYGRQRGFTLVRYGTNHR